MGQYQTSLGSVSAVGVSLLKSMIRGHEVSDARSGMLGTLLLMSHSSVVLIGRELSYEVITFQEPASQWRGHEVRYTGSGCLRYKS